MLPRPLQHFKYSQNFVTDSFYQSSLVLRFVNNDFQENKEPTIGGKITASTARCPQKGHTPSQRFRIMLLTYDCCSCFSDTEDLASQPNHQI